MTRRKSVEALMSILSGEAEREGIELAAAIERLREETKLKDLVLADLRTERGRLPKAPRGGPYPKAALDEKIRELELEVKGTRAKVVSLETRRRELEGLTIETFPSSVILEALQTVGGEDGSFAGGGTWNAEEELSFDVSPPGKAERATGRGEVSIAMRARRGGVKKAMHLTSNDEKDLDLDGSSYEVKQIEQKSSERFQFRLSCRPAKTEFELRKMHDETQRDEYVQRLQTKLYERSAMAEDDDDPILVSGRIEYERHSRALRELAAAPDLALRICKGSFTFEELARRTPTYYEIIAGAYTLEKCMSADAYVLVDRAGFVTVPSSDLSRAFEIVGVSDTTHIRVGLRREYLVERLLRAWEERKTRCPS